MSPAHAVRQPPPEPRRRGMTLVACGAVVGIVVPSVTAWAESTAPRPDVDTTPIAAPEQTARPTATASVPLTIVPADEPTDPGKSPGDAETSSTVGDVAGDTRTPATTVPARTSQSVAITTAPVTTQAPPVVATPVPQVCIEPDPLCESEADHQIPTFTPPPTTAPATSTAPETTTPSSEPETTAPEPTPTLVDELLVGIEEIVT